MNDTNPDGMTKSIAPAGGEAWPLMLDEHGKLYRPRNALEFLSIGKLLIQIKAAVPHGKFMSRVEALGLTTTAGKRYMKCARLFDLERDALLLTNAPTKLYQLLSLEREEIETLRSGGWVRGFTLESLASQ